MPCYYPIKGWRSREIAKSGKRPIVFEKSLGYLDLPITLPCGRCLGCKLERSRQWAMRCVNEAQMHDANSFITLTYDDDHLPPRGSLYLRHFQLFMKRFRENTGVKVRYYHCGEYGSEYGRPHYHAIIFGYGFPDRKPWKRINGNMHYRSNQLESLWTHKKTSIGYSTCTDVTFEGAAYVARYILKKITGDPAPGHYQGRKPEYSTMSRGKGIGHSWFQKYQSDVYPSDQMIMRGKSMPPPKYYNGLYEIKEPDEFRKIKLIRKKKMATQLDNNTPERLKVRLAVKKSQINHLPRIVE